MFSFVTRSNAQTASQRCQNDRALDFQGLLHGRPRFLVNTAPLTIREPACPGSVFPALYTRYAKRSFKIAESPFLNRCIPGTLFSHSCLDFLSLSEVSNVDDINAARALEPIRLKSINVSFSFKIRFNSCRSLFE